MSIKNIKKIIKKFNKYHCHNTKCSSCEFHNMNVDNRGMSECPLATLKRVQNKLNEKK